MFHESLRRPPAVFPQEHRGLRSSCGFSFGNGCHGGASETSLFGFHNHRHGAKAETEGA
jgi:nitrate reductase beta subunit